MVEVSEQVSWNLANPLILQIADFLRRASEAYLKGDIAGCFHLYREVRFVANPDFKDEEREGLKEIELKISENLKNISVLDEDDPKVKTFRSLANYHLCDYREKVLDLLGEYGYLIAKKQDSSKMF